MQNKAMKKLLHIGLQEGKTRIKINYKNENSENVSEVYEAAVDKDLNVTILKIE